MDVRKLGLFCCLFVWPKCSFQKLYWEDGGLAGKLNKRQATDKPLENKYFQCAEVPESGLKKAASHGKRQIGEKSSESTIKQWLCSTQYYAQMGILNLFVLSMTVDFYLKCCCSPSFSQPHLRESFIWSEDENLCTTLEQHATHGQFPRNCESYI